MIGIWFGLSSVIKHSMCSFCDWDCRYFRQSVVVLKLSLSLLLPVSKHIMVELVVRYHQSGNAMWCVMMIGSVFVVVS